jgi:hypothetical protein
MKVVIPAMASVLGVTPASLSLNSRSSISHPSGQ